ncbi:MAG TPA: transglutaminase domain-containing protein [Tepidisphaeraceae bacterium]|jgi:hypothetical protein
MTSRHPAACAFRWFLTAAMLSVWTGIVPALAQQAGQPNAALDGSSLEAKGVEMLGRLVDMGKQEIKRLADASPDAADLAAQLDYDPAKLFSYVRDQVRTEPYAGVLRGAQGALSAKTGNASDKALLLKAMLDAGGRQARLVTGTLGADGAKALVAQFLKAEPLAGPLGELLESATQPDQFADFCRRSGLDEKQMTDVIAQAEKQAAAMKAAADKQADEATAFLKAQLTANKLKIGQSAAEWADTLAKRVTAHAWVQVQDEAGKWIDLDPSFADAKPGDTKAADGKPVEGELPGRYAVQLSLLYATNDGKEEERILSVPLYTDEALFRHADFMISPADKMPPASELLAMPAEERVKLFANAEKFQAVLRHGARGFGSKVFDLKGKLFDVGGDGRVKGAGDLGGATGGMFGGLAGGGEENKNTFKSLVMEFEFQTPPNAPKIPTQRRTIVTAEQIKGQHIVSPVLDWEILIQPQLVSAGLNAGSALQSRIAALEPVLEIAKRGAAGQPSSYEELLKRPPEPYPQMLMQWSMFRQVDLAKSIKAAPGVAPLWDAPQVVVAERRFCMNKKTGHMCDRSQIDIVHNGLTAVPRNADADGAGVALRQGVYDTVTERVMLETLVPDGITASAAATLDEARVANGKLGAFSAADAAKAPLAEADQQFVASSESNRHVLVPAAADGKPVTSWWSIDPVTGSVVGRSTGGFGASIVENATLQQLAGMAICFVSAGKDMMNPGPDKQKNEMINLFQLSACMLGGLTGLTGVWIGAGPKALGIIFYINAALGLGIIIYK